MLFQTEDTECLENIHSFRKSFPKAGQFFVGMVLKGLNVSGADAFLHAHGEAVNDVMVVF